MAAAHNAHARFLHLSVPSPKQPSIPSRLFTSILVGDDFASKILRDTVYPTFSGGVCDLSTWTTGVACSGDAEWYGVGCEPGTGWVVSLALPGCVSSAPFPSTISQLTRLTYLDLSNNRISGTVPAEISALAVLSHLDLSDNLLYGTVPTDWELMRELTYLDFSGTLAAGWVD